MVNLAGKYEGKMMTWKEMVEIFPSKWVYVTDYEMDGPDIVKGRIVGVVTDEEDGDMYIYCRDNGIDYMRSRTTEGFVSGFNIISEIES